ncbi:hypothetical protein LMG7974_01820 [Campylobacter majalis]|uniref:DUF596 domain-containing protein n=1 Tax=Campylobacter majalis TaxID=2790656 RepID=A0ABN7KB86_9BACT|nr:hypothetical protein [Campylobacter majalis]CAD7289742.1 hypothetical protein LMG7974_01820 [Campylobacter majalis]
MNNKIYEIVDLKLYEIYYGSFGCSCLIVFSNEEYEFDTIEEDIEAFLYLFKRLVDEGLILVHAPINGEPEKEIQGDKFWDVSSDRMIEYIRSVLPSDPKFLWGGLDDKDDEWSKFWYYDCPTIRWVDKETGQIY